MAHGPEEELGVHVQHFLRGRVPWRCVHSLSAEVPEREQDELLDDNRRFAAACAGTGLPVELVEGPGEHDWAYWDARIVDVLDWLPIRRPG